MKKKFITLLTAVFFTAIEVFPAGAQTHLLNNTTKSLQTPQMLIDTVSSGDVNNDKKVNLKDAQETLKIALAIITPSDWQSKVADVNNDGKVKLDDALKVLKMALGIESIPSGMPQETLMPSDNPQSTTSPSDNPVNTQKPEETIHKIYSESDLSKINSDIYGKYELMNNIRLVGDEFSTIDEFCGELNGNGYTISNVEKPLFNFLNTSSVVSNLNISTHMNATESAAVLALNAYGTVSDCSIKGKVTSEETDDQSSQLYLSTFAIINYGIIDSCTNEAVIIQNNQCGPFSSLGGIVSLNYGTISNCTNNGYIESCSENTGGIAGNGYYISETTNGIIINCTNNADVFSKYEMQEMYAANVGGIAAKNIGSLFLGCINNGRITHEGGDLDEEWRVCAGGICGETGNFAYMIGCKNTGQNQFGICAECSISTGTFDENGNFNVSEGNIIVADCTNDVTSVSQGAIYSLYGGLGTENGEIRITRCKNYVDGILVNKEDIKKDEEIFDNDGNIIEIPKLEGDEYIIIENNGDVEQLEPEIGISYEAYVNQELSFDISKDGLYVNMFTDNPLVCTITPEGTVISKKTGTANLYGIESDGRIVIHPLTVY